MHQHLYLPSLATDTVLSQNSIPATPVVVVYVCEHAHATVSMFTERTTSRCQYSPAVTDSRDRAQVVRCLRQFSVAVIKTPWSRQLVEGFPGLLTPER